MPTNGKPGKGSGTNTQPTKGKGSAGGKGSPLPAGTRAGRGRPVTWPDSSSPPVTRHKAVLEGNGRQLFVEGGTHGISPGPPAAPSANAAEAFAGQEQSFEYGTAQQDPPPAVVTTSKRPPPNVVDTPLASKRKETEVLTPPLLIDAALYPINS